MHAGHGVINEPEVVAHETPRADAGRDADVFPCRRGDGVDAGELELGVGGGWFGDDVDAGDGAAGGYGVADDPDGAARRLMATWQTPRVQGLPEASRTRLLAAHAERVESGLPSVLFGLQSFGEGLDLPGNLCATLFIAKLPFAPPDDPVLAARIEVMEKQGKNGFMHHTLPEAIINLKQGAGRLIRDETDRGVLMICDPRLITKPYGKRIWRSLPPMRPAS